MLTVSPFDGASGAWPRCFRLKLRISEDVEPDCINLWAEQDIIASERKKLLLGKNYLVG